MRWVCPHCSSKLDTPGLESGKRIAGPQAGWAYVRCFKCTSFAAVEIATARAVVVNQKTAEKGAKSGPLPGPVAVATVAAKPVADASAVIAPIAAANVPPPFVHHVAVAQAPVEQVSVPRAPDALDRFLVAPPDAQPFPAPLPELEERVLNAESTFGQILREEVPYAMIPRRGSNQIRAVLTIGAVMTALAVTASYSGEWLARSRSTSNAPVLPAQAPDQASPHKRAQAAAKRMEAPATAPIDAANAPIPAAPLGAALTTQLARKNPEPRDVRDTIQSSAMAPTRPQHDEPAPLFLQARKQVRTMELRTGPGPQFPLLGLADLSERYPVVEWKDRWFKIQLEETPGLTAWVAYERIELFSQDKDLKEISEEVWQ